MQFKKGMRELLKHPMNEAQFAFDISRGKIKPKDAMGDHQRMMNKWTVPLFGDNKVSKNSDAIAAAIVGSFFAGPAMAAAGGSSAGGGAAGGAAGTSASTGAMGLSTAFTPSTAFGAGSTGSAFGSTAFGNAAFTAGGAGGSTGAMGMASSYAPTTAFGSTAVAGQGLGMSGYAAGSGAAGSSFDWMELSRAMKNVQPQNQGQDSPNARANPRGGGSNQGNPFAKSQAEMYGAPTYRKRW